MEQVLVRLVSHNDGGRHVGLKLPLLHPCVLARDIPYPIPLLPCKYEHHIDRDLGKGPRVPPNSARLHSVHLLPVRRGLLVERRVSDGSLHLALGMAEKSNGRWTHVSRAYTTRSVRPVCMAA